MSNFLHSQVYDELVSAIYDATTASGGFQNFIDLLIARCDLKAAMLLSRNLTSQETGGLWVNGLSNASLVSYALEFGVEDPLAQHLASAPVSRFYASNIDLDQQAMLGTRFYREWVLPQGLAYAAAAIILREGQWINQIVIQRGRAHPPFLREELDGLDRLIPHLQRAIQIRQRFSELGCGDGFLADGLEIIAAPALLINEFGCLAHANQAARRLLAVRNTVRLEENRLRTCDMASTHELNLQIIQAVRSSRGLSTDVPGVVIVPRSGERPLMLFVTPLRTSAAARIKGAALIVVYDTSSTPFIAPALVEQLFGLSGAEACLAVALCAGLTLDEAAASRAISIHTVRAQLKSIFNKTGTNRQTDLVSMLLASPAYFLAIQESQPYPGV